MNFCYWYAIIWSGVLFLYSFGWSDLCDPLAPELVIFFAITIPISVLVGYFNRDLFRLDKSVTFPRPRRWVMLMILTGFVANLVYSGQIPILMFLHGGGYQILRMIPTFYPLLMTYSGFYCIYLYYAFICTKKKVFLVDALCITAIYVLLYVRSTLMMLVFMIALFVYVTIHKHIRPIYYLLLAAAAILVLYIFGGMGNVRQGFVWNDSSYIQTIGYFNDQYPQWLPKEFMWAYSYITSPLDNFNYNVLHTGVAADFGKYAAGFFPDFLSKRLFAGYEEALLKDIALRVSHFNAVSGFTPGYVYGGITGMLGTYIYLIFGQLFILRYIRPYQRYVVPVILIMNINVTFMFFVNTISYSACSFQMVYPLLTFFLKRKRVSPELNITETGLGLTTHE